MGVSLTFLPFKNSGTFFLPSIPVVNAIEPCKPNYNGWYGNIQLK